MVGSVPDSWAQTPKAIDVSLEDVDTEASTWSDKGSGGSTPWQQQTSKLRSSKCAMDISPSSGRQHWL